MEDKTALYWVKMCNCIDTVCLYMHIKKKLFARLMITLVVMMTSTVKVCPSIKDTIFPPYRQMSKYSVWS